MTKKLLLIAHRGESFDAPENSLAAINLAWERDDDAVEIDVRLAADDKIVVIHDHTTKRTGKRKLKIHKTFSHVLKEVDIGSFKEAKWSEEKIPLLSEVLANVPPKKRLFVELKGGIEIVRPLVDLVKHFNCSENVLSFIGFKLETIGALKKLLPKFEAYWLLRPFFPYFRVNIERAIQKAKSVKADGLDLHYKILRNPDEVNRIHEAGLKVFVWTVNDVEIARKFVSFGVDGITSDKAAWLKAKLGI